MAKTIPPPTLIFFLHLLLVRYGGAATISPIKTVVVLVMENRSFDHMLGWMKKLNPEINGVDGSESNPINTSDPNSRRIFFGNQSHFVDPDPGHTFQDIQIQVFGSNQTSPGTPPMNGFVQQASSTGDPRMPQSVMNGFLPDKVPVFKTLVSEFAVFDRWFASMPAETQPNRLFVHSGTSYGSTYHVQAELAKGYPQRTIFEDLEAAGKSFGIYYQNVPATLFYRNLRKVKYVRNFHQYSLSFKGHAKAGKLPAYVVVEPRYFDVKLAPANDDHPSHDVHNGQLLVKEVYETLRASPQWNETALVITYDEHGGFYDHVPTPTAGVSSPDGIVGPEPFLFKFDRLGVRVPTIVISPWIKKGIVVHGPNGKPTATSEYEHSSIPATVRKIFNLPSPPLTKREEWAGTFEGLFQTLTQPRTDCPVTLPTPVKIRDGDPNEKAKLSAFQQELIQLSAIMKGHDILVGFPASKFWKDMNVKEGKAYIDDAVRSFFEAGLAAKKMGADDEQIVKMRTSLSTRI